MVAVRAKIRGISCQYCGSPIRLSVAILKREMTIKQDEGSFGQELYSRVFAARCRVCHQEGIYNLNQIAEVGEDSEGEPSPDY